MKIKALMRKNIKGQKIVTMTSDNIGTPLIPANRPY